MSINKTIKVIIFRIATRILSVVNQIIPKKDNIILLYSSMSFRDNIEYLYNYLIINGYNKKYTIIRSHNEPFIGTLPQNVKAVTNIKAIKYYFQAGHVFYCFDKLPIYPSRNQCVIQMWHGTPFKGAIEWQKKTNTRKSYYTYILMPSHFFDNIAINAFGVKKENIAICGQPRNDVLFHEMNKNYELQKYSKVVIWLPTYRQHKETKNSNAENYNTILPIINNDNIESINSFLKERNVCVIIKLHPLQKDDGFIGTSKENLYIFRHEEFQRKGWNLYEIIAQSDALITDYSSVFYDYLLLDRPIAFTVTDIEEYQRNRGFEVENPEELTVGDKIRDTEDFYNFITAILDNRDEYASKRREICKMIHTYNDGNQTARVLKLSHIQ